MAGARRDAPRGRHGRIQDLQLREIKLFFRTYKELLPGHDVVVKDYYNQEQAVALLEKYEIAYREAKKRH